MRNTASTSYGRILKTSAMLGGSTAIGVVLGAIRIKVLAVHLGPGPYGIMGLYGSLLAIISVVAGLGISYSAVREIAEASGKGDASEIAHTTVAIRRLVWVTGMLGVIITIALAWPASYWTFGNSEYTWAFCILSLTVLVGQISSGQTALLQGLRRIRDIASIKITGAVLSTALAIPILLWLGERGIVPFMLAVSVGSFVVSWSYARRVKTSGVSQTWRETWRRSQRMVRLGVVLIVTGMLAMLATYLVRLIIQAKVGATGVGLYQSAFTLSSTYVGFILTAMGTDYFPRLTEVAGDRVRSNQLVNEQTNMALVLGVPGLVAAIVLAELIIWAFYSSAFAGATEILRWTVLGLFFRLVAWPIGFILLARSDKRAFFWSELLSWSMLVALTLVLVKRFGAAGAGMAFAGMYLFCAAMVYTICRYRHGFMWHPASVRMLVIGGMLVASTFAATFVNPKAWRYSIEVLLAVASVGFSAVSLYACLGRECLTAGWARLKVRLGLKPQHAFPDAERVEG